MMDLYIRKDGKKPTLPKTGRFQALMETVEEGNEEDFDEEGIESTCDVCGAGEGEMCAASCWSCHSGF